MLGSSTDSIAATLGDMLRGGIDGPVSMWQAQRSTLMVSGLFLLLALLCVLMMVVSMFKGPTDMVYAGVARLAAFAESRRRQGR